MDIHEIRLKNIEILITEKFNGVKAGFARGIDRDPVSIGRWWTKSKHKRNVGSPTARYIETKFHLPQGWLDRTHIDNSDLEQDPYKKQNLRIKSGQIHKIPLLWTAILEKQQLILTLLQEVKGQIMLLSTDKDVWSIQLVGTHPSNILNQGWGIVVEPSTPLCDNEYTLIKRKNGEILLRVLAFKDKEKMIVINPISGETLTLALTDIETAQYCYIGIPPSKIHINS